MHDHSWNMGQTEAYSTHWLRRFSDADAVEVAHASWLSFMACNDSRKSLSCEAQHIIPNPCA